MERRNKYSCDLESLRRAPVVEHLDISKVWKGLTVRDSEILFEMHLEFRSIMGNVIAQHLMDQGREPSACSLKSSNSLGSLQDTTRTLKPHRLDMSLTKLIQSLIKPLEDLCVDQSDIYSPTSLIEFALLYLLSCDCLADIETSNLQDMAIPVCMHYEQRNVTSASEAPTIEISWSPDFLSFYQLDELPRECQEIRIVPQYRRGIMAGIDEVGVEYSIEPRLPWLKWHRDLAAFVGVVPMYSERLRSKERSCDMIQGGREGPFAIAHLLRIEVKAVLTERHSLLAACLKRTVRSRLTLKVIPWYARKDICDSRDASFSTSIVHAPGSKKTLASELVDNTQEVPVIQPRKPSEICSLSSTALSTEESPFSPVPQGHPLVKTLKPEALDIEHAFKEHRHKKNVLPSGPRTHIDELYGLGFPSGLSGALQVYHAQRYNPNWTPAAYRRNRPILVSDDTEPGSPSSQHHEMVSGSPGSPGSPGSVITPSTRERDAEPFSPDTTEPLQTSSGDQIGLGQTDPVVVDPGPATVTIGRSYGALGGSSTSKYDEEFETLDREYSPIELASKKSRRRGIGLFDSSSIDSMGKLSFLGSFESLLEDEEEDCDLSDMDQVPNRLRDSMQYKFGSNGTSIGIESREQNLGAVGSPVSSDALESRSTHERATRPSLPCPPYTPPSNLSTIRTISDSNGRGVQKRTSGTISISGRQCMYSSRESSPDLCHQTPCSPTDMISGCDLRVTLDKADGDPPISELSPGVGSSSAQQMTPTRGDGSSASRQQRGRTRTRADSGCPVLGPGNVPSPEPSTSRNPNPHAGVMGMRGNEYISLSERRARTPLPSPKCACSSYSEGGWQPIIENRVTSMDTESDMLEIITENDEASLRLRQEQALLWRTSEIKAAERRKLPSGRVDTNEIKDILAAMRIEADEREAEAFPADPDFVREIFRTRPIGGEENEKDAETGGEDVEMGGVDDSGLEAETPELFLFEPECKDGDSKGKGKARLE